MVLQGRKLDFIWLHIPKIWHTYLPRKDLKVEKEEGGMEGKGSFQYNENLMV